MPLPMAVVEAAAPVVGDVVVPELEEAPEQELAAVVPRELVPVREQEPERELVALPAVAALILMPVHTVGLTRTGWARKSSSG